MTGSKGTSTSDLWLCPRWERRGFGVYVPGTSKRIAEVPIAWKKSAEAEAITSLIAAAPDLYSALEAMLYIASGAIDDEGDPRIRAARFALAKARGDSK